MYVKTFKVVITQKVAYRRKTRRKKEKKKKKTEDNTTVQGITAFFQASLPAEFKNDTWINDISSRSGSNY